MAEYDNFLLSVILFVSEITVSFLALFLLRNKINFNKAKGIMFTFIICTIISSAVFVVPRAIDYQEKSYITIEECTFTVEAMNRIDEANCFGVMQKLYCPMVKALP